MPESQNGRGALFTGGVAAILASTCCLGPLLLGALGFSGACPITVKKALTRATQNAGYPSTEVR